MSLRASWKGAIGIGSFITVPVKVFPAKNSGEKISFNELHRTCKARIQQEKKCSKCGDKLATTDIVKGYAVSKDQYVVMEESDFDQVKVESLKKINLEKFTNGSILDPRFIDASYYLGPDGPVAASAFAVIREAIGDRVGVGKVALRGREYFVAVAREGRGFLMHTMLPAAEVRDIDAVEELASLKDPNPAEVEMARKLIDAYEDDVDLADFVDEYNEGVRKIIDAKLAGKVVEFAPQAETKPAANLMDALQASLSNLPKKKQAKAAAPAKAKKPARKAS